VIDEGWGVRGSALSFNLEADGVPVVLAVPEDGDHGEEVGEAAAILAEVGEFHLHLGVVPHGMAHLAHCLVVDELAAGLWLDLATGGLKEAAVLAHDLGLRIAREHDEGVRGVDDGRVGLLEVAKQQGDGAVDGSKLDLWVGSGGYPQLRWVLVGAQCDRLVDTHENAHHVES
jgi:hypothetical protein